jgi:polar amino acid transport system permease protein
MIDALVHFFRWLNDAHGINLSIFYDRGDALHFWRGVGVTAWLSLVCIATSTLIGFTGAWLQQTRSASLRLAVSAYVEFFRNTPPLIQLYFFFFAIGALLPLGIDAAGNPVPLVSNYGWAILSFSLFAGAFNVEIFRAGVEAVPATTVEAAQSLGLSRRQVYLRIVLPLALRFSLPAYGNNVVNLVKTTTLAYAIAVPETLYAAAAIWSEELNVREMMNVVLIVYLLLIALLVLALKGWERALRLPGFGHQP